MINAEHFTKAEELKKPDEVGLYICLLEDQGRKFFAFCSYSPKNNPGEFFSETKVSKEAKVIAWVRIEDAENTANELSKQ